VTAAQVADRPPGRCVVVGGAGAVGAFVADLLAAAGATVLVVDPAAPQDGALRADVTALCGPHPPTALIDELSGADTVVLAVPEQVALRALAPVAAACRPGTLLVDTLSVKSRIAALAPALPAGLEVAGINPMFAPSLGLAGRPVAAVVMRDGPRVRGLLRLIVEHGGRVVEIEAAAHDRLAAATQALTHAAVLGFGLALARLAGEPDAGFDLDLVDVLAPPPHRTLLMLLARILAGPPEVYWDVQNGNALAGPARAALAGAVTDLAGLIDGGDAPGFGAALDRLRAFLGDRVDPYAAMCADIFAGR
jgi:prephenate dehydrogenase